jgi:hypothetical protein
MNLTMQILQIILPMRGAFVQHRTFLKFIGIIFAILCVAGRHTVTSMLYFFKMDDSNWCPLYRLFSRARWNPEFCYNEVLKTALKKHLSKCKKNEIVFSLDDFKVEKTGKTIPGTRYILDPKSPAFNTNLVWGHRYLHGTIVIYRKKRGRWHAAKSISVKLQLAPHIRKPGKKATAEDWETYKKEKEEHNLSKYAVLIINELRRLCDEFGYEDKDVFIVADGGYCNKNILRKCPKRVELILRCRKDAKLCEKSTEKRKFYDSRTFTPNEIYKDSSISEKVGCFFYGRNTRRLKYKQKPNIYWQTGTQKRPMRCIIVHGVPYRKKKSGYTSYREPMYLLTTDLESDVRTLIQFYFYRWEIEVTHREIKNDLGIGQPQVWNEKSVERCPKVIALANSIIHLAHYLLEEKDNDAYLSPPKWYQTRTRISLEYLRRRIRNEVVDSDILNDIIGSKISRKDLMNRIAA